MRSSWSGFLGFGMVQAPVKLYKAVDDHDIGFHQHHAGECLGRIGLVRTCKDCGEKVEYADIVKGIERDGTLVIVDGDDLAQLVEEQGKQIEILQFVPVTDVDPILYETSYYVGAPDGGKVYALLAECMSAQNLVAIGKFTRSKTQMCALRITQGVMVLHTLLWPDELRAPEVPGLGKSYTAAELKGAKSLVSAMIGTFDPEEYHDEYTERLDELIDARAGDMEFVPRAAVAAREDVSDLLAQLEASVAAKSKKPGRAPAKAAPKKAPAKKAAPTARKKRVA